jgi:hypothetical protein
LLLAFRFFNGIRLVLLDGLHFFIFIIIVFLPFLFLIISAIFLLVFFSEIKVQRVVVVLVDLSGHVHGFLHFSDGVEQLSEEGVFCPCLLVGDRVLDLPDGKIRIGIVSDVEGQLQIGEVFSLFAELG